MKETFERKTAEKTLKAPASKPETVPKSSQMSSITAAVVAAICTVTAAGKTANAEPVTWKIGMPFGDDVNGDTETTFRGITPGEKPNRFRLTYTREPIDISANEYVYDKWIEIDDGPDNAVVVRELSKAEFVIEYPNPQYGYYGHPDNNLEYCIDGVIYKIQGFPASLQQEKNGILVNGQPAWNPYPYPDGLDSDAVIDVVTRSADPTKISIFAGPFFPNGDWLNNDGYYSWEISVLEKDVYDAIQKAIDEAWAKGQNPYEAGLANPLDDTKGSLYASPETDKLLAMTRWKGYGPLDDFTRTYFFSGNSIANQYVPLQRDNSGTWLPEGNTGINGGLGEADFIDYGGSCDTENTPVGALSRETPQGGKEHIFIIESCGIVRALILEEQPDNSFTEPTLIHEEDSNVDVSGESILCVNSNPAPEADKGPEQVEAPATVEQPIVAEEPAVVEIPAAAEQPNTAEIIMPTTADEGAGASAEQPTITEIPNVAEQPVVAEPMPDVISVVSDSIGDLYGSDAKAETVEEAGGVIIPPVDVKIYVDIPAQNPDTSSDTPQNPDTKPTENVVPIGTDNAPDMQPITPDTPSFEDTSDVVGGQDIETGADAAKTDTAINGKDTVQPSQEKSDSGKNGGGCNCNAISDSGDSTPVTSISVLILALVSRLRRKSLPTIDH